MATSGKNRQGGNAARPAPRPRASAKVYRRRRQVVGVLALLVLAGLVTGGIALANFLGSLGASDAGTPPAAPISSTASPAANGAGAADSPPATVAPAPAATPSGVCNEAGIKVSGSVDRTSYAAGEDPRLSLRVTNTGQVPCDINVGTSQMQFKVTSGEDLVFNSRDCQADSTNLVKNLKPGASETANFTWKRNRSAAGCAKVTADPGAGTYVFVAILGKWSSGKVVFQLQ